MLSYKRSFKRIISKRASYFHCVCHTFILFASLSSEIHVDRNPNLYLNMTENFVSAVFFCEYRVIAGERK